MNIDDMTYGDLKRIAAMFGAFTATSTSSPMVGKYCVVRCYSAGVHAGRVVSQDGDIVVLADSRRLWQWKAKAGIALSGVAVNGLQSGKIDSQVSEIMLTGVIELIPCSSAAQESINDTKNAG